MNITQANTTDFEPIMAFYNDVINRTPDMAIYARWKKNSTQQSKA